MFEWLIVSSAFPCFQLYKKWCLQTFRSIEKWMKLEIVDKYVFKNYDIAE